ncbi:MAG: hypothetical protein V1889_00295 [archaeon]
MEEKISYDIGEEIISKLKELNYILERILEERQNGQKFTYSHSC